MGNPNEKPRPFPGLGSRIRGLRSLKGWTQFELASRVGVRPLAVNLWENEQATPKAQHLPALASALGVSLEDLTKVPPQDSAPPPPA